MAEQTNIQVASGSAEKKYSYVLHGAKIFCSCGSRESRLVVPLGNGTNIHDMPMLTVKDCSPNQNIQGFGFCSSMENPQRQIEMDEIMEEVEGESGFLDNVMNFFSSGKTKKKKSEEYAQDVQKNVLVCCVPEFASNDEWQEGTEALIIGKEMALNSTCSITCKWGGNIVFVEDGQQNAIEQQTTAEDFDTWSEEAGMPELTDRNQQTLDKNVKELEQKMNSCTDPEEKASLQKELEQKKELKNKVDDSMTKLKEIEKKQKENRYYDDIGEVIEDIDNSGDLDEMVNGGQVFETDKDNNIVRVAKNKEEAKEILTKELQKSNDKHKELEAEKQELINAYKANSLENTEVS